MNQTQWRNVSSEDLVELAALEEKVNALLPPQYQFCAGPVSPMSMGSAGLKFEANG